MVILNWKDSQGTAAANGQLWTLKAKPDLGFEYEEIGYSMGGGSKSLQGTHTPLPPEDLIRIEQWLSSNNPHQQNDDLVHGADAQGQYLGLVPLQQAVTVLLAPPPSDGEQYLWSLSEARWVRQ